MTVVAAHRCSHDCSVLYGATIALERARETLGSMLDTDAGHVEAVVWAGDDDGSPWPILVLDRADEVFGNPSVTGVVPGPTATSYAR